MFTDKPWPTNKNKSGKPVLGYGYYQGEQVMILEVLTNSYNTKAEFLIWFDSPLWVTPDSVDRPTWYIDAIA